MISVTHISNGESLNIFEKVLVRKGKWQAHVEWRKEETRKQVGEVDTRSQEGHEIVVTSNRRGGGWWGWGGRLWGAGH
jgi:hypothetical protein